jgi:hypothetical protein
VKNAKCTHEGCNKSPTFNYENETKAKYCSEHKKDGMVNVKSKRCELEGCNSIPTFNIKGGKPQFCVKHKTTEMVNLKSKQ